jgi:hypothetical protein
VIDMVSRDWEIKTEAAYSYRKQAELWQRGWVSGPKTKKGKRGFYNRILKALKME